jgi:hypothetical protein
MLQFIQLAPHGSTELWSRWEDAFSGSEWHVFRAAAWSDFRDSGSYIVNGRVLTDCFNQTGWYKIRFDLTMSPLLAINPNHARVPENLWSGELRSSEITLKISKE